MHLGVQIRIHVCVGGGVRGSQRLVDFEQILKVSLKCCTGVGRRALGCV